MMVLKENCDVNKLSLYRRAKKPAQTPALKIEDFVVQASRSDEISEFSNGSAQFVQRGSAYAEDGDSDDDIMNRVESVVATAAKIKARRPLQKLQQDGHVAKLGRKATKLSKIEARKLEKDSCLNEEVSQLQSSSSNLSCAMDLGDDTSSEIQALVNQANLLAPNQQGGEDIQSNKTEETVLLLLKELTKQSVMVEEVTRQNKDAMLQISLFEQLVSEKDQELEDARYYNEMNDCANKRMLTYAHERNEEQLKQQQQRVTDLIKIIQRQQFGGTECVNSLIREKCLLQKELYTLKIHLDEEALLDKQHLKRVQCAVAVTALVSAYIALASGLDSFLYIAPLYFLFVFFAVV